MAELLRVLVADDEPLAREGVVNALRSIAGVEVVAQTVDGPETLIALESGGIDVAFLDIRMPGLDAFQLLDRLEADPPAVVFVTAFDDHALRAFEAHAIDYVLKPVDEERLRAAFDRARAQVLGRRADRLGSRIAGLLQSLGEEAATGRLAVRLGSRDVLVAIRDIDYVEGDRNYVRIVTDGRRYTARGTMKAMERRLAVHDFVRIHRSTLVNLDRVREIRRDRAGRSFAILADGTRLRVSDSGLVRLKHQLDPI